MTESVELRNVTKRFEKVTAVDGVSLKISKAEFFSLLGPSGCGKTTTLRLIGGLETPDEGEVLINGKIVNQVPPYRRDCSIVFQNLALFPHMTVEGNISFGLQQKKTPKKEIKRRVGEMLDLVQLSGMEKRRPSQLSGGQQQRVALARSIVLQPEVLLLDEPLASLDRKLREEMRVELRKIQKEVDITFIYVTHDQEEALSMSDRIAVMKDGKFEQIGGPSEVHNHPKTKFVAAFTGASNIFTGRVIAREGGNVRIKTNSGLVILACKGEEPLEEEGSISVRPEAIEVLPKDADWEVDNKFIGKIVEKVYLGDITEVRISMIQGEQIIARLTKRTKLNPEELSIGDEVLVGWDTDDSNLLID